MHPFPEQILQRLERCRVVAGFSVDQAEHAVPIARALLAGGIDAIELTLRKPAALEGVRAICAEVSEMLVGVGTILTPDQVKQVQETGADFGVAPGLNANVVKAAQSTGLPFAPGVATPSDLESAIELGCRFVKFFPAQAIGGANYLRSMSAPYQHLGIRYFPLGGLNADNMNDYLVQPNVVAIGGSWIVKKDLVDAADWDGIMVRAKEVVAMLQRGPSDE